MEKSEITVRFARREELERVNELREQVHKVHSTGRPDIFVEEYGPEIRAHILDFWNDESGDVIVAEKEGVLCGFACVSLHIKPRTPYALERKFYEIEEFGVEEGFRRQGVATELFAFIRADAAGRGFERLELNMWEFNEGALAFYEKMGFKTYRRYMEFTEGRDKHE